MSSSEKAVGYVYFNESLPYDQPIRADVLRPDFNRHVIGPLSHVVVGKTLDAIGNKFLLKVKSLPKSYRHLASTTNNALTTLIEISVKLEDMGREYFQDNTKNHIDRILNSRQHAAAKRFGSEALALDQILFDEINTIAFTVDEHIGRRHPELALTDAEKLIKFLRDPETPDILRGFAPGGNAFNDSLVERRNEHPAGKPWRDDPTKPTLDTAHGKIKTTSEVREAARQSRIINENMLDTSLFSNDSDRRAMKRSMGDAGVRRVSKRFSSGCPARFLTFQTNIEDLVTNGFALEQKQIDYLITATNPPVIAQIDTNNYVILRDSYAEVCNLLANAVEILTTNAKA